MTTTSPGMAPSLQVKFGSRGVIVNLAHLSPAGADRLGAAADRYPGSRWVSHRLQFTSTSTADLPAGPGVDGQLRALFGRFPGGSWGPSAPVGLVDLRRIGAAAAASFAVAGLGGLGRTGGGVLAVVTDAGVRLVPPPPEPSQLAAHLAAELDPGAPVRPTVELLHRLAAPMLADARRVNAVVVPLELGLAAVTEWAGATARDAAVAAGAAYRAWHAAGGDERTCPPLPSAHVGALRVTVAGDDDDLVRILSAKGPLLADRVWLDEVPVLAANTDWTGPVSPAEQELYASLRAGGLEPAAAAAVVPDLLPRR